jgi:DNA-nicking Smr family endonuclease
MDERDEDEDARLFRDAMRGVRPLDPQPVPASTPRQTPLPPAARRRQRPAPTATPGAGEMAGAERPLPQVERGEVLEYRAPGVQRNVLRNLRRGQPAAAGTLDLHGLSALKAAETMRVFLAEAGQVGARCVRIVHGKGLGSGSRGPVLKTLVNTWLREQRQVLAFVSAPPEDGGTGATLVLLNRPSKDPPSGGR